VADAPDLRGRLAREAISVRDCSSFGLLGTVRIAVPDDAGRRRLADALEVVR
jgi:histidinol-phosphate/aromatic aminotransferase/cobyric acid decarboxylase-like protein